jgi:SecD/SecF fusion protein
MNAKNLPLKFSFVALLIVVSVWSVFYGKGIRQGIDLRGGHSLVFEIRTNEMEQKALEAEKKTLEAQMEKAKADNDQTSQDRLHQTINGIESKIESYKQLGRDPSDLSKRMITILKSRIDPDGLLGTEWRPLGNNRIEVRMPAGGKAMGDARNAYFDELDRMDGGNLEHSDIRRLIEAPAAQREDLIATLSHGDVAQADRLRKVVTTYGEIQSAQARLTEANKHLTEAIKEFDTAKGEKDKAEAKKKVDEAYKQSQKAGEQLDKVRAAHEEIRQAALKHGRLSPESLQKNVLAYYVAPREAAASGKEGHKTEIQRRRQFYQEKVDKLLGDYSARQGQIRKVIESYEKWANLRGHLDDPSDLKRLIAKAGVLEFRIVPHLSRASKDFFITDEEYSQYERLLKDEGPDGVRKRNGKYIWLPVHGEPQEDDYPGLPVVKHLDGRYYILAFNQEGFMMLHERPPAGWTLTAARSTLDQMSRPAVDFEFDDKGAGVFAKLTDAHRAKEGKAGHCMAIVLDDVVYSAPAIRERISSRGIITGRFTREEASELAQTLEAGSLPAKLNPNPVSENTFGPTAGEVNLRMGLKAGCWGMIVVTVFMILYYRLPGLIADVALVLNILLILGAMSLMSAVLTMPGMAGVILTIGMAVDANVLIYERLREEQAKGQSVRMTLKNAYSRAFSAIFDSNLTTLLVCLILGWVGSEEVRGFAITLGLGVVISMFTALVVTRWIFQLLLDWGVIRKPLSMARLIGVPTIGWMSKRYFFWGLSLAFMVMGVVSLIWQGSGMLGIEFTSGTQVTVRFRDDALIRDPASGKLMLPNDALVNQRFIAEASRTSSREHQQLAATARVEKTINPYQQREFLNSYDKDHDGRIELNEWHGDGEFFKLMDAGGDGVLTLDELAKRLPAGEYQITTTVTDPTVVRPVVAAAYGDALQIRTPCTFRRAPAGIVPELGVAVDDRGASAVNEAGLASVKEVYRYELEDFVGGAMFVFRNVEPGISEADLRGRIREMRSQADFAALRFNKTKVIGLTKEPDRVGKYAAFLVAVLPAETVDPDRIDDFIRNEGEMLDLALERSEAGEIRTFDAAIAGEMKQRAIVAVILGWLSIIVYLWFRFGSVRWGLAAVICLIHDVTIVVGLVAMSGWLHNMFLGRLLGIESFKIDLAMVAAVLTIIGYSVNDTIVVFDRIRENRGKLTTLSYDVIDRAINQTLSRTLLTGTTTVFVLVIMYIWGGMGIHPFSYALLVGVAFGTYSSIAVASPLLVGFKQALIFRTVGRLPERETKPELPPVQPVSERQYSE